MSKHSILVPTDGSDFSRQVFSHIREYLPAEENELTLIRVSATPHGHTRSTRFNGAHVRIAP